MAPVADRMAVDFAFEAFAVHLVETGLEDVVTRCTDFHVRSDDILEAIGFGETGFEAGGDGGLVFVGVEDVGEMLGVCVETESCYAEVDVEHCTC